LRNAHRLALERRRILLIVPRNRVVPSPGAPLGRRVSEQAPVVVLEVAERAEPRLSRHPPQRRRRVAPEQVLRIAEPQAYELLPEGDADDAVEQPTEVELAHVRDRGDLGKREPAVGVHTHMGQRAADGTVRRRYPTLRLWVG